LRDYQQPSTNVDDGTVHFTVFVFEDPKVKDLIGEIVGVRFRIAGCNAKQNEQSAADLARESSIDGNSRPIDTLDDGPHQAAASSM
jgi:hypothetical protein